MYGCVCESGVFMVVVWAPVRRGRQIMLVSVRREAADNIITVLSGCGVWFTVLVFCGVCAWVPTLENAFFKVSSLSMQKEEGTGGGVREGGREECRTPPKKFFNMPSVERDVPYVRAGGGMGVQ